MRLNSEGQILEVYSDNEDEMDDDSQSQISPEILNRKNVLFNKKKTLKNKTEVAFPSFGGGKSNKGLDITLKIAKKFKSVSDIHDVPEIPRKLKKYLKSKITLFYVIFSLIILVCITGINLMMSSYKKSIFREQYFYHTMGTHFSLLYKNINELHSELSIILLHKAGNPLYDNSEEVAFQNFKVKMKKRVKAIDTSSRFILESMLDHEGWAYSEDILNNASMVIERGNLNFTNVTFREGMT